MHKCEICGERFVGMTSEELKQSASRHIWEEHRNVSDPDKPIVVEQ